MNNNIHLMNEAGTAKGGNPTTNMLPKNEKKNISKYMHKNRS